ncbi:MAG TPA: class I SAM-dependent methyltransferase, partial [Chthonomonadaceae bacterium]|nr:class I SAM-dependent methyltransferase [Chthonomonadaceae bacterium]
MTTIPAPRSESRALMDARIQNSLWTRAVVLQDGNLQRSLNLLNFAGRNYPTLADNLMITLLGIAPHERVLDIGGGDAPFSRAEVVTDAFPDDNAHRSGRALNSTIGNHTFVQAFAESLPFADGEFDFAYCRAVMEHTIDPAAACREMMRVARRGFIETPSRMTEYIGGHPTHRWLTWVEQLPGQEPTFVFRRKPFRRAPFRYALRPLWFQDADFRFRWEWQYRNLTCTQFAWEGSFSFRVEEDPYGIDYDDPNQAAEAHLDAAINALRFGGIPPNIILPDVELAVSLRPNDALAHNALGCALWLDGRIDKALAEFRE